jgi:glutathione S-transferase
VSDIPTLFGAAYSVYVRGVRLALAEKSVPYKLVEIDVFAPGGPPADYLARQPFGRIPAFEHDGFRLYEAGAIARYVDEAFPGPALQPGDLRRRARMNQIIGILDSYAYRTLVWDIYVERVSRPASGKPADEDTIAAALPKARTCLAALAALMDGAPYLAGPALTLADLHAAPMFAYFLRAREAQALMDDFATLRGWWERIAQRDSVRRTEPPGRTKG